MYKKLLGKETFPLAFKIEDDQKHGLSSLLGDMGQVMGELYSIPPMHVVALDLYMLNTVQFERIPVQVLIPFKPQGQDKFEIHKTEAMMYVGRQDFWNDQLKDAEQRKLFSQSKRLFAVKETDEPELGAYFTFDYNIEARKE